MIRLRPLIFFSVSLIALTVAAAEPAKPRSPQPVFSELCAGCHGVNLEGGAGPSLVSTTWKYGGDEPSLAASIRNGHTATGMPAFGSTLSPLQIRGLVVYIREQAGRAASGQSTAPKPLNDTVATTRLQSYRIETAVPDLKEPWSIAFLPDGRMLVTEKTGALRVVEHGIALSPVTGIPVVDTGGQAGLFDVVLHPDYSKNGWVYLALAEPQKSADGKNVSLTLVIRGRIKDNTWTDQQIIFRAELAAYRPAGGVHFGGRLAFDRDGFLFFSIGERGRQDNAQDLTVPTGKIHRVHDDGGIPNDNPFLHTPGALPSIWSYGHRNPQGLRLNPVTGELWEHEHGPRGGDELNRIQPGRNYGWPVATYGMNYNGTPITDLTTRADIEDPVTYWIPSIAPCGMAFYTGDRFPAWKNHLFVTSLAAQELHRLEIKEGRVVDQEVIFKNLGRMRDVATGPDGLLYVLFPDRIARLVPAAP